MNPSIEDWLVQSQSMETEQAPRVPVFILTAQQKKKMEKCANLLRTIQASPHPEQNAPQLALPPPF